MSSLPYPPIHFENRAHKTCAWHVFHRETDGLGGLGKSLVPERMTLAHSPATREQLG